MFFLVHHPNKAFGNSDSVVLEMIAFIPFHLTVDTFVFEYLFLAKDVFTDS